MLEPLFFFLLPWFHRNNLSEWENTGSLISPQSSNTTPEDHNAVPLKTLEWTVRLPTASRNAPFDSNTKWALPEACFFCRISGDFLFQGLTFDFHVHFELKRSFPVSTFAQTNMN